MKTEIIKQIETRQSFHIECGIREIEELYAFFEQFQNISLYRSDDDYLYEEMTVKEYLYFFASLLSKKHVVENCIKIMHLDALRETRLHKCNKSQRASVIMAREMMKDANTFFMIEPLRNLDEPAMKSLLNWMETAIEKGKQVITVSSSLKEICLCPGSHYYLEHDLLNEIDQGERPDESNQDSMLLSKLSVKSNGSLFLFNPEEVDYIEANTGKCYVFVRNDSYTSSLTLDELEVKLKQFGFYRCHRSYLVNVQKVTEIVKWTRSSYSLRLSNYKEFMVPLSKSKIQEMREMYHF